MLSVLRNIKDVVHETRLNLPTQHAAFAGTMMQEVCKTMRFRWIVISSLSANGTMLTRQYAP